MRQSFLPPYLQARGRLKYLKARVTAQKILITVRVWIWGLLMDLARVVAPYPAIVVMDDEDTWGLGYVWLITPREYERICQEDGCYDTLSNAWERVYEV